MKNLAFDNSLQSMRHTASHVLAQAVKRLFPDAKLAIGPAIDNGFYYDFESSRPFTPEDLTKIEGEMQNIVKAAFPLQRFALSREEAIKLLTKIDEPYKIQLVQELPDDEVISFYQQGDFVDLCAGPHIDNTSKIGAFRLTECTGSYWKGDAKNHPLHRIYGLAYESVEELEAYLISLAEAKKRDHRKLGKELDLFSIDDYVGSGLVLWHPKLSIVREEIELYWRKEHRRRGYEYLYTPHLGQSQLWETSGHLSHFADGMYPPMTLRDESKDTTYYAKPMSCPFHVRIYKTRPRSYRELPLRWCELGSVYRYEQAGALHGMLRVRGFTQDDAHIICKEDQFVDEVNSILDFAFAMNKDFGFEKLNVYLSVRDPENMEKYIPNEPVWQLAESTLEHVLLERGIAYAKDIGGAKFYGPAIDLKAVDSMGREWQGTTIQLDMNLPERFGMTYIGPDGKEHTPIMLHRTLLGSMERFVGTLIEQYAGAFPLWLAPVQVKILPISEAHLPYAKEILSQLKDADIRAQVDEQSEKLGYKIRAAQLEKVPYMLIVGDKEVVTKTISMRSRSTGETTSQNLNNFTLSVVEKIRSKAVE